MSAAWCVISGERDSWSNLVKEEKEIMKDIILEQLLIRISAKTPN